jgi:GT2 family glycosyltransferase
MAGENLQKLDDDAFVERAYRDIIGRPSDPEGHAGYVQRLRQGTSRQQVLADLQASDEGRRRAAQLGRTDTLGAVPTVQAEQAPAPTLEQLLTPASDEAFIDAAYRAVLARTSDSAGRRTYLHLLRRGASRLDVLDALLQSPEGRRAARPLPDLRAALAGRVLSRWRVLRPPLRLVRRCVRGVRQYLSQPGVRARTSTPQARSRPTEGPDPLRPRDRPRRGLRPAPPPTAMNHAADKPFTDPATGPTLPGTPPAGDGLAQLHVLAITGPLMQGWSGDVARALPCSLTFAGVVIGKLVPDLPRADLALEHGLADAGVGFAVGIGGLLQFAQLAAGCHELVLAQQQEDGASVALDLRTHAAEALTFAPMRALARPLPQPVGQIRSVRLVSPSEAALLFEADRHEAEPARSVFLDFYQEAEAGRLVRVGRFAVELGGQLHELTLKLLDVRRPLLMVVTDEQRRLVCSDCFPLPNLFARRLAPLIDYHVTMENGSAAYAVAAKLARSFLDRHIDTAAASRAVPRQAETLLLLYTQAGTAQTATDRLDAFEGLAASVVLLDDDGQAATAGGASQPVAELLRASGARHVLLADADDTLRPDFWPVLASHAHRLKEGTALIHWHSLWAEPGARLQVAKVPPLLHPAFREHRLFSNRALMVTRELLMRALEQRGAELRSGALVLEKLFDFVEPGAVAEVPVPMHIVRVAPRPAQIQRLQDEQTALPVSPRTALAAPATPAPGVSAVINFRDSVTDTRRTLSALHQQQGLGELELLLVNNGSLPGSVQDILAHAHALFGTARVQLVDYPHRFNHSAQCNVAAAQARHEVLLMLSNDALFVTPGAVASAARVAMVPWVGSCGFRIVGNHGAKRQLQSLGLALSPRRHLFAGGSPIGRGLVPAFALDCSFEVVGNTFAAAMVRREVYRQLDGLDSEAFPTNYNDVDFCFRASNAGFRHVVLGAEVVEHTGRGSREFDQDLPVDPRLVERAPRLDQLCRMGFHQL